MPCNTNPTTRGMMSNTVGLVGAVMQTNLRATHDLLRAESPKAVADLQKRFACEYATLLMQGTTMIVETIDAVAKRGNFTTQSRNPVRDPLIIILEA
jgi:hypothetical protein